MRSCQSAPIYVKSSQLNSSMIQVGLPNEHLKEDREKKSFGLITKHQLFEREKRVCTSCSIDIVVLSTELEHFRSCRLGNRKTFLNDFVATKSNQVIKSRL